MRNAALLVIALLFCGCKGKNNVPLPHLTITHSLKFTGLDSTAVSELNQDSAATSAWQSLIPVYKMPADTDLKNYQPAQPGKYVVNGNAVIFSPDTPFASGQLYFVRYYHFAHGSSLKDHILHHTKMSDEPYTDLIFKQ